MITPKPKRPPLESAAVRVPLPLVQLAALDQWIARSANPTMSRPEAIRHILSRELSVTHNFMDHPQKDEGRG